VRPERFELPTFWFVGMRVGAILLIFLLSAVAFGVLLPFTPLAVPLGFVSLSAGYLAYVMAATLVYLVLVGFGKRFLLGRIAEIKQ
jgi:hypothetical protein